jgi:AraC-like DNA-binding protein
MLHLFVPPDRLEGISADAGNKHSAIAFDEVRVLAPDSTIEGLAWLLFKAGAFHAAWADVYVDGIAIAILAKLLHVHSEGGAPPAGPGLVTWRLKRVKDFIEADIAAPLSLRELASCAGLSRMHFAAQFRAATGMKPHEYVVRRRIQRAQEILRTSTMPLAEVALTVGFQTQAHFTTVFRRALSETPGRWRRVQQMTGGRDRRGNDATASSRLGEGDTARGSRRPNLCPSIS